MAGLAAVGAALPPLWLAGPRRDPAADWPEGPGIRLGRGAIGWGAPILSRPHPEGKELGHVFPDDVVRIMREVVGLGMAYHTHVWFELEEGFVYSPYLQPVYNLPQTPLTGAARKSVGGARYASIPVAIGRVSSPMRPMSW